MFKKNSYVLGKTYIFVADNGVTQATNLCQ